MQRNLSGLGARTANLQRSGMEPLCSAWSQLPVSLVLALNAAKRLLGASTFPPSKWRLEKGLLPYRFVTQLVPRNRPFLSHLD